VRPAGLNYNYVMAGTKRPPHVKNELSTRAQDVDAGRQQKLDIGIAIQVGIGKFRQRMEGLHAHARRRMVYDRKPPKAGGRGFANRGDFFLARIARTKLPVPAPSRFTFAHASHHPFGDIAHDATSPAETHSRAASAGMSQRPPRFVIRGLASSARV
jgi:hypothetical protein